MTDSVATLGVVMRTRAKRLGAKEEAKRKKCSVRFSLIKKNKAIQKRYKKVGVKKLLIMGLVPARAWRAHAVGIAPTERVKIEETDGSCSRKEGVDFALLVPGSVWS